LVAFAKFNGYPGDAASIGDFGGVWLIRVVRRVADADGCSLVCADGLIPRSILKSAINLNQTSPKDLEQNSAAVTRNSRVNSAGKPNSLKASTCQWLDEQSAASRDLTPQKLSTICKRFVEVAGHVGLFWRIL